MGDNNTNNKKNNEGPKPKIYPWVIDKYVRAAKMAESGGGKYLTNDKSSAKGSYQFTDAAWAEEEKRLGRKLNRNNPAHEEAAMKSFTMHNAKVLQENGYPVNENSLYALHHFGTTGGLKMLNTLKTNPNASAIDILGKSAANANKAMFYNEEDKPVNISELFNKVSSKMQDSISKTSIYRNIDNYQPNQRTLSQNYLGQDEEAIQQEQMAMLAQQKQEEALKAQAEEQRLASINDFFTKTNIDFKTGKPIEKPQDNSNPTTAQQSAISNANRNFGLSGSAFDHLSKDLYAKSEDPNKLDLQQNFEHGGRLNKQDPPKDKKPIYVKSKNDPRYKAYQDSLWLYNVKERNKQDILHNNHNIDNHLTLDAFERLYKLNGKYPDPIGYTKPLYIGRDTSGKDRYAKAELYKKPEQQVIIGEPRTKLQPIRVSNPENIKEQIISAEIPIIRQQARIPKYYNIEDTINSITGGTTTYKLDPNSNEKLIELGPGNTRKITPVFKYGGELEGNPPTTPQEDFIAVKEWTKKYINSDKYKERLTNSGYSDPDRIIERRSNNVDKTKLKEKEQRFGTYYDGIFHTVTNSPETDKRHWKEDSDSEVINSDVLAHEFGHAELLPKTKEGVRYGSLNKQDYNDLGDRLRKEVDITDQYSNPYENKADLNSLRYELYRKGIYDAGKEDFTKEHLDKVENSIHKERLLKNYKEEDLIYLMNKVAYQNKINAYDQRFNNNEA